MAIPNPNPNIADGIKCDNKTYSSNKIESLITAATELPIPEAGDAGKVLTVNAAEDGYELDTPIAIDDETASDSSVYSSSKVDTLLSGKQNTITSVSHAITPAPSATVSPFTYYGEYNFSSDIGGKTVLSVVIEGGGSNNAHTYSFVSNRVRIYANAADELTVTLYLI